MASHSWPHSFLLSLTVRKTIHNCPLGWKAMFRIDVRQWQTLVSEKGYCFFKAPLKKERQKRIETSRLRNRLVFQRGSPCSWPYTIGFAAFAAMSGWWKGLRETGSETSSTRSFNWQSHFLFDRAATYEFHLFREVFLVVDLNLQIWTFYASQRHHWPQYSATCVPHPFSAHWFLEDLIFGKDCFVEGVSNQGEYPYWQHCNLRG